jgi:ectoine hydroxylase-related dioxygenase (phytanoyl-CoA dioxygenase family)
MPKGSMCYFLNTLWHGGGANKSKEKRRAMTVQYCQPWIRPNENLMVAVGWDKLDEVPKKVLELCGYTTHQFAGYVDGRSPRAGVEMRKKRLLETARKEWEREAREKSTQAKL